MRSGPHWMHYGIVHRPKPGRDVSGDAYLITEQKDKVLIALADGLGSGQAAAEASQKAMQCIEENSTMALGDIMAKCHHALRGTRGAVMMLMHVDFAARTVSFMGVGNIGVQVRSVEPIKPISKNGIVGYRLPRVVEFRYRYTPGDLFVLHSDGISSRFALDNPAQWKVDDLQALAEEIAQRFGKNNDDLTIIVVR
jgi:negative regulator of sigma-B (phosphoserine phosphatase)